MVSVDTEGGPKPQVPPKRHPPYCAGVRWGERVCRLPQESPQGLASPWPATLPAKAGRGRHYRSLPRAALASASGTERLQPAILGRRSVRGSPPPRSWCWGVLGLECEGAGYLGAPAARGRGVWEAPRATERGEPGTGPGAASLGRGRAAPERPAAGPAGCAPASAALRAGQGRERRSDVGRAPCSPGPAL